MRLAEDHMPVSASTEAQTPPGSSPAGAGPRRARRRASRAPPSLDMRGPQARLVVDLERLNDEPAGGGGGGTPMPELQDNLRLLVDMAAADHAAPGRQAAPGAGHRGELASQNI